MPRSSVFYFLPLVLLVISGCGGDSGTNSGSTASSAPADTATNDTATLSPVDSSEPILNVDPPADTEVPQVSGKGKPVDSGAQTGSFRGVVTFKGDVPEPQVIQTTKDREVCSAGEGPVTDVVVKDGKLVGAVIELTIKGDDLPDFVVPKDGFVLRQKDCLFSPRLLVAYSGAELVVHNDDKVEHNVNTGQWNLLQSPGAKPIKQKMNYGGNPFTRVTCNIHSWMESWVYLARSPFYAASNEAGEFVIEGVPAGTKIRGMITHATLGKQRFTIDVEAGKATEQNFEFEAK